MRTILLDFDGTVIDFWERYYRVFCTLTDAKLSKEEYINYKRLNRNDEALADALEISLSKDYFDRKKELLEKKEFLKSDSLLVKKKLLMAFTEKNNVILLSRRRNHENFLWELRELEIAGLAENAVCIDCRKIDWIKKNILDNVTIIGDDVYDLETAGLKNVSAVMVLTGISDKKAFDEMKIEYTLYPTLTDYVLQGVDIYNEI